MMKLTVIVFAAIVLLLAFVSGENDGLENCQCSTTFEYNPVCGSNGVTYTTLSMLKCAKRCLGRSDLTKVSDGACP